MSESWPPPPPPAPEMAESVLDLVGNTPIVKLPRLARDLQCTIALKLETTNPGGSSKDRPAVTMIDAAERDGLLKPGGTIVEPTSGNTGVGLAIVAAQRGYRCVFVMTDKVAPEKVALLRAYGAEVVVCPVAVPPDDPDSYYSTAERLTREIDGSFRPNQYANPANPLAHELTTGPEIWRQTDGKVTHVVAGVGTSGTIVGISKALRAKGVRIVAVQPDDALHGIEGWKHMPSALRPAIWDERVADVHMTQPTDEAIAMTRRLARDEGIFTGPSGGAAVAAATRLAREEAGRIVVLIADGGERYLSTPL